MENGVDISDMTRWYEADELSSLKSETRNILLGNPERASAVKARKRKRNTSPIAGQNNHIAAIITGVMNVQRNNSETPSIRKIHFPASGKQTISSVPRAPPITVSETQGEDNTSLVTYDQMGNVVG